MPPSQGKPQSSGKNVAKSSLFQKLGKQLVEIHNEVKDTEIKINAFGDLPGGIENGVAELVDAHFGEYKDGPNVGKLFFMAQGIVVKPTTFVDSTTGEEVTTAGRYTKIGPEALCDTPQAQGNRKTLKDHVNWMYQQLAKLGVDRSRIDPTKLEATLANLVKAAPKFKFRTWLPPKREGDTNTPRVVHLWEGLATVSANGAPAEPVMDDQSGEADTATASDEGESSEQFNEMGDLDSLVSRAEEGDMAARKQLIDMAVKAGHSKHEAEVAESWQIVADMATSGGEGEEKAAADDSDDAAPSWEAGDMARLAMPKDPRDPRKGKRKVDVEVVKVYPDKGTCDVKSAVDNKITKGVKLDSLEMPQE